MDEEVEGFGQSGPVLGQLLGSRFSSSTLAVGREHVTDPGDKISGARHRAPRLDSTWVVFSWVDDPGTKAHRRSQDRRHGRAPSREGWVSEGYEVVKVQRVAHQKQGKRPGGKPGRLGGVGIRRLTRQGTNVRTWERSNV